MGATICEGRCKESVPLESHSSKASWMNCRSCWTDRSVLFLGSLPRNPLWWAGLPFQAGRAVQHPWPPKNELTFFFLGDHALRKVEAGTLSQVRSDAISDSRMQIFRINGDAWFLSCAWISITRLSRQVLDCKSKSRSMVPSKSFQGYIFKLLEDQSWWPGR